MISGLPNYRPATVTAVTVTYGSDRFALCAETVERAVRAGVGAIVIVANGVPGRVAAQLKDLRASSATRIHVVTHADNLGSAGGFAAGMAEALAMDSDFVWLLDDDNWPEDGALDVLLGQLHSCSQGDSPLAVGGVRPARPAHRKLLDGCAPADVYPPPSSYLSFDVLQRLARVVARGRRHAAISQEIVDVPYSPYGGLLIPAGTIKAIGFPEAAFHLYEDDTEFTHRIPQAGGRLLVCLGAVVHDADVSWSLKETSGGLDRLLTTDAPGRMLYALRNRAYFDTHRYAGSRGRLALNRSIFKALLRWRGLRLDRRGQVDAMLDALARGDRGELGVREEVAA